MVLAVGLGKIRHGEKGHLRTMRSGRKPATGARVFSEPERQAPQKHRSLAWCNEFVSGGAALGFGALRREQMAKARGTPHELARRGELETLGDGFFCFLHLAKYRRSYPNAMSATNQNWRGKIEDGDAGEGVPAV